MSDLVISDSNKYSLVGKFKEREVIELFKDLPYVLPSQVYFHFRDSSLDKLRLVALSYSGNKKSPSLQEWIESYQHNEFLSKVILFDDRGKKIAAQLVIAEKALSDARESSSSREVVKPLVAEVKRLNSLYTYNESYLTMLHEKLNKFVTEQLKREAPKKLEVSHSNVISISDFQRMINVRDEDIVDAHFDDLEEV